MDCILCSWRWRSSIQSAKTRTGVDCSSDHEILIAKFRIKLKKAGEPLDHSSMTNPLWSYSGSEKYIQGIRSDRQSAWWTMDRGSWHCTGGSDQTIPKKKKCQKAKWLSEEALQIAEKGREAKGKWRGKIYPSECRVPKNSKERKESLLKWTVQRNRGKQHNGKD